MRQKNNFLLDIWYTIEGRVNSAPQVSVLKFYYSRKPYIILYKVHTHIKKDRLFE